MLLLADPRGELVLERRQVEEEMRRLLEDRGLAVDLRAWVLQIDRIQRVPAVVALIPARVLEPADGARPLDVAVGQRPAGRGGERPQGRLLEDEAVVVKRPRSRRSSRMSSL